MKTSYEIAAIYRVLFDTGHGPADLNSEAWIAQDIHCVSALVKLFFRELPSPLVSDACLNPMLKAAVATADVNSDSRAALQHFRKALYALPRLQYR